MIYLTMKKGVRTLKKKESKMVRREEILEEVGQEKEKKQESDEELKVNIEEVCPFSSSFC